MCVCCRFCKKHPGFMSSVKVGAASAISECQHQFRSRRWNCSTYMDLNKEVKMEISKKINSTGKCHLARWMRCPDFPLREGHTG